MNLISLFLIYVVVFRLAIISIGAISIILGYKLFCRGVFASFQENSGVMLKVPGSNFKLKNAAPGTIFALFGAVVVIVMLTQGNPQLTLETLNRAAASSMDVHTDGTPAKLTLRGQETDTLEEATLQGLEFERDGDKSKAIVAYERAASAMAEPLNDLAWLYQSDGRLEEATALSALAVAMRKDPRFLDTLAEIKFKNGDHDSAVRLMEKAVALSPSPQFKEKLRRFKNEHP